MTSRSPEILLDRLITMFSLELLDESIVETNEKIKNFLSDIADYLDIDYHEIHLIDGLPLSDDARASQAHDLSSALSIDSIPILLSSNVVERLSSGETVRLTAGETSFDSRRRSELPSLESSELLVPLFCRGELLAVLCLREKAGRRLDRATLTPTLTRLSNVLSLALAWSDPSVRPSTTGRLDALFTDIGQPVVSSDLELGVVIWLNRQAEQRLAAYGDRLIGESIDALMLARQDVQVLLDESRGVSGAYRMIRYVTVAPDFGSPKGRYGHWVMKCLDCPNRSIAIGCFFDDIGPADAREEMPGRRIVEMGGGYAEAHLVDKMGQWTDGRSRAAINGIKPVGDALPGSSSLFDGIDDEVERSTLRQALLACRIFGRDSLIVHRVDRSGRRQRQTLALRGIVHEGRPAILVIVSNDATTTDRAFPSSADVPAPDALIFCSSEGRCLSVLDRSEPLGFDQTMIGRLIHERIPGEAVGSVLMAIQTTLQTSRPRYEVCDFERERQRIPAELTFFPGPAGNIWILIRDLSSQYESRRIVEQKLAALSSAMETSFDGLLATDREGNMLVCNDRFYDMWQFSRFRLFGGSGTRDRLASLFRSRVVQPDQIDRLFGMFQSRPEDLIEERIELLDGRFFEIDSRPRRFLPDLEGRIWYFHDATNELQQRDQVAYYDPLTALPNRFLLKERLSQLIRSSERERTSFAVLSLDLDNFSRVNKLFGQAVGDRLITEISDRLRQVTRRIDTVARTAGDVFVLLLPEMNRADAKTVVEKIRAVLFQNFDADSKSLSVSATIGAAFFPDDARDSDRLLHAVDMAVARAKREGHNLYRAFDAAVDEVSSEMIALEIDLRRALELDQLFLVYQPQIRIDSCKMAGAEALLRWRHPEMGVVSPAKFIPIAESNGLIGEITEWALREACRQNRCWQMTGLPVVPVSVNLSAVHFRQDNLLDVIEEVLKETDLSPELLGLELTESLLMENHDSAVRILRALKNKGLFISLDDFGTGYSSLSYLYHLPFSALKIDRSFVMDMLTNGAAKTLTSAIIGIARKLQYDIVAEGVETQAQLDFLRNEGCQYAQGYYFSPPLAAEDYEQFLRRHSNRECSRGIGDGEWQF